MNSSRSNPFASPQVRDSSSVPSNPITPSPSPKKQQDGLNQQQPKVSAINTPKKQLVSLNQQLPKTSATNNPFTTSSSPQVRDSSSVPSNPFTTSPSPNKQKDSLNKQQPKSQTPELALEDQSPSSSSNFLIPGGASSAKQTSQLSDIFTSSKTKQDVLEQQQHNLQAEPEVLNVLKHLSETSQSNINSLKILITDNNKTIFSRLDKIEQTLVDSNDNIKSLNNNLLGYTFQLKNIGGESIDKISQQTDETIESRIQKLKAELQEKTAKYITEDELRLMLASVLKDFKTEVADMIEQRFATLSVASFNNSQVVPTNLPIRVD